MIADINIIDLLNDFDVIDSSQLYDVNSSDFSSKKYIVHKSELKEILKEVRDDYFIAEIKTQKHNTYRKLYYDTSDFLFYFNRHRGLNKKTKYRSKLFLERDSVFFEIKRNSTEQKIQSQEVKEEETLVLSSKRRRKIAKYYKKHNSTFPEDLRNKLQTSVICTYTRFILVNKNASEHCVIDLNLSYKDLTSEVDNKKLEDLVIIKLRYDKKQKEKGFSAVLRERQIRRLAINKYVLGVILTQPEIKHNNFKPLLKRIEKLIKTEKVNIN